MNEGQQIFVFSIGEQDSDQMKNKIDAEHSLIYKIVAGLVTSLIPVSVIWFFDLHNKKYLEYYNISDIKLSYSWEMVLKEVIFGGIILLILVICAYLAACALWEIVIDGCRFLERIKIYKRLFSKTTSKEIDRTTIFRKSKKVKFKDIQKRLCWIFSYVIFAPIAFLYYFLSLFEGNRLKGVGEKIESYFFGMGMLGFVFTLLFLAIIVYTLEKVYLDKKNLWRVILFVFPAMGVFLFGMLQLHIKLEDFISLYIFNILPGMSMLWLYMYLFFTVIGVIWYQGENKLVAYFSFSKSYMQLLRFITIIGIAMVGTIFLLASFNYRAIQDKQTYLMVYKAQENVEAQESEEKQENGEVIGVAIYQDDTRMIVLPAKVPEKGSGFQYELTGDTNYMYVDKSGVIIEQINKKEIDWKNHLNIDIDSNMTQTIAK